MRSPVAPGPHTTRAAWHWLAPSGIVLKLVNSSVAKTGVKTVAAQYPMDGSSAAASGYFKPVANSHAPDENPPNQTKGNNMLKRLLIALVFCITPAIARAADLTITISAGDSPRTSTPSPSNSPGRQWPDAPGHDQNKDLPLYISGLSATFILPNLAANQSVTFKLQSGEANADKINLTAKRMCSKSPPATNPS